MEERFSLLIKVEHKAHWVIDLCHRPVWCLASNGKRQRESQRDRESERQTERQWPSCPESRPVSFRHSLPTCDYVCDCVWAHLPEFTLIPPFVCVMIKTRGGVNIKEKRIFPILLFENDTYCSSFLSFFVWWGAREKGRIISASVRFGEQMRWGDSEGALFWLCSPMFDQEHTGPWLDSSSALLGDSAPAGAASDKTARAFENQSILHTAGKSAFKTHNTKL